MEADSSSENEEAQKNNFADGEAVLRTYRNEKTAHLVAIITDGVQHDLLMTDKLQFFYLTNSNSDRGHALVTTTHKNKLIFLNTICLDDSKRGRHILKEFEYFMVDGATSDQNNLIFLGVVAHRLNPNPKRYRCYMFDSSLTSVKAFLASRVRSFITSAET